MLYLLVHLEQAYDEVKDDIHYEIFKDGKRFRIRRYSSVEIILHEKTWKFKRKFLSLQRQTYDLTTPLSAGSKT